MKMIMYMSYDLAISFSGIDYGKYLHGRHIKGREHKPLRLARFRTIYIKHVKRKGLQGPNKQGMWPEGCEFV